MGGHKVEGKQCPNNSNHPILFGLVLKFFFISKNKLYIYIRVPEIQKLHIWDCPVIWFQNQT